MKETDSLIYVNNGKSVYIFDQWLDEDILPLLDKQIQNKNFGRRNLFILHTIGSHWWYNIHYTHQYARWKPELKSRVLSANTKEEFFNSYDNSVLYSDFFWNEVRNRFRNRNAIIIYLSDHAESLGEKESSDTEKKQKHCIILAVGYGCQTNTKLTILTNGKLCKITRIKNIILHFYSTPS